MTMFTDMSLSNIASDKPNILRFIYKILNREIKAQLNLKSKFAKQLKELGFKAKLFSGFQNEIPQ